MAKKPVSGSVSLSRKNKLVSAIPALLMCARAVEERPSGFAVDKKRLAAAMSASPCVTRR